MKSLVSIRMRASKKSRSAEKARNSSGETHISGAEGLFDSSDIQRIANNFIQRALHHERGKPDSIVITIESLQEKARRISTLPLSTLMCHSPSESKYFVQEILRFLGISARAIQAADRIIQHGNMRGASIIHERTARRLEHNRMRGVRVSRFGIQKTAAKKLGTQLSRLGIHTDTVREALILASKVASCSGIMAELCVSDDLHYTTGYIASKKLGYLRIPKIKRKGSRTGGRVFFVKNGTDISSLAHYLERIPVLVTRIAPCRRTVTIDEIQDRHN